MKFDARVDALITEKAVKYRLTDIQKQDVRETIKTYLVKTCDKDREAYKDWFHRLVGAQNVRYRGAVDEVMRELDVLLAAPPVLLSSKSATA